MLLALLGTEPADLAPIFRRMTVVIVSPCFELDALESHRLALETSKHDFFKIPKKPSNTVVANVRLPPLHFVQHGKSWILWSYRKQLGKETVYAGCPPKQSLRQYVHDYAS